MKKSNTYTIYRDKRDFDQALKDIQSTQPKDTPSEPRQCTRCHRIRD